MNYSTDNKIWRVGGPLFAYLGINFMVQLVVYMGIFYMQFNEWSINAAFNGLLYAEQLNETEKIYTLIISGLSALISLPIFFMLMKKDYEYPVNRRHKERSFDLKEHAKRMNVSMIPLLVLAGVFATLGLSRLMLMIPLDGILGDYSEVKEAYEAGAVWVQFIVLGILTPVVEELLFRGIVYKRLKLYYEASIAAYIAAIIFGVAHFNLVQGLYAFVMGILFSYVYEKYKNIYAPIILHVIANLTAVLSAINPISVWIDEHIWVKLPLALVETVIFAKVVLAIYRKKDIDNKEPVEEINKIDFSI